MVTVGGSDSLMTALTSSMRDELNERRIRGQFRLPGPRRGIGGQEGQACDHDRHGYGQGAGQSFARFMRTLPSLQDMDWAHVQNPVLACRVAATRYLSGRFDCRTGIGLVGPALSPRLTEKIETVSLAATVISSIEIQAAHEHRFHLSRPREPSRRHGSRARQGLSVGTRRVRRGRCGACRRICRG